MPYKPELINDLNRRLTEALPDEVLVHPEDPEFPAFLTRVRGADEVLAQDLVDAVDDESESEAQAVFADTPGATVSQLMAKGKAHSKGASVRGQPRIRPKTFLYAGVGVAAVLIAITALMPENRGAAGESAAQAGAPVPVNPATPAKTDELPRSSEDSAGRAPTSEVTADSPPVDAGAEAPLPSPTPTPAPLPTPGPGPYPESAPIQAAPEPAPSSDVWETTAAPTPAPARPAAAVPPAPQRVTSGGTPSRVVTVTPPRAFTPPQAPAPTVTAMASSGTATAPDKAGVVTSGAATPAATQAVVRAGEAAGTSAAALVSGGAPAEPRRGLVTTAPPEQVRTAVLVSAGSAAPAAGGLVSAGNSAGGTSGAAGRSPAFVSGSPAAQEPAAAGAETPQAALNRAPMATPGRASPVALASAVPFPAGSLVTARLDTGVAVVAGGKHVVWATSDRAVWRGEATLDDRTGRVQVAFSTVLVGGAAQPISGYLESADGPGLGGRVRTVVKDMAQAALNSVLNSAVGFVKSQSQATTSVTSTGVVVTQEKPQNFWLALGGGLANAFIMPDVKASTVRLGELQQGEEILIRVDVGRAAP